MRATRENDLTFRQLPPEGAGYEEEEDRNISILRKTMQRPVAQVSNLLYRRFPIGSAANHPEPREKPAASAGWKHCDTAGWKPALRRKSCSPGGEGEGLSRLLALSCLLLLLIGCRNADTPFVVVYTSQDQVYAEPILQDFARDTGIEVRPVFDSEAVKTVGLINRLIAEQRRPQCDLLWNNEELRMRQLVARGVVEPEFIPLGYRARRIVVNTNLLDAAKAPSTLAQLTNDTWKGRVVLAYPLFGTTATHFLALRQHWGDEGWNAWCRTLRQNAMIVDGNSVVVKQVSRGEAWIGLTDSDDIAAAQREGLPVAALPILDGTLFIPNTLAVISGAPRPEMARRLMNYLASPQTLDKLVAVHALEGTLGDQGPGPAEMDRKLMESSPGAILNPDWPRLLDQLESSTAILKQIFLR
jgi:iron(III) transport system substrate-binding protein